MSASGFVGYQKNKEIKGWFNFTFSYYSSLGAKLARRFQCHSKKELEDFFLNRMELVEDGQEYYDNQIEIYEIDWGKDSIKLQDNSDFLFDGIACPFGYVFNLDNDTLDLYRGGFKKPQECDVQAVRQHQMAELFGEDDNLYTHRVISINREDIVFALNTIFSNKYSISKEVSLEFWNLNKEGVLYPERDIIEREREKINHNTKKSTN
mgnify:CR=1 FL=1